MNDHPVQESADVLDEVDIALINALQFDPRAPWSTIGAALGIDPATAARRWSRLVAGGVAWVVAHPGGPQVAAFVEVDCAAGQVHATAQAVAAWPPVLTVEHVSGGRDLLLTVTVPTLGALSRLVTTALGALDGVRATRTHLVTRPHVIGGDWRLRALTPGQRARLGKSVPATSGRQITRALTPVERELVQVLSVDARTSLTEIADAIGTSASTVRRRLGSMIEHRSLEFRCDMAQPLSGWPVSLTLWAQAPGDQAPKVAQALAGLAETRVCLGLTGGASNFLLTAWLRSLEDTERLEQVLADRVPAMRIIDRTVTLSTVKRMGRLLGPDGRAVGVVPLDIWSDSA
ncbi:Lrp/AsnC family transcriptional regulator [Rhodococcus sp. D2-41]|uniref:Lrp/AsnC family transcriptional regulator n=1 Tax=Speluncibacter jeojiensis TaxID=2710754 RepID=UPI0024101119|nr:Lrp/AsnC family transcriptional regulator [Rhodococcus sp. D2-41]MDG3009625.1 Lrp/AsnC family transcriptional regulator [Rhodococcus sp. D2-41]